MESVRKRECERKVYPVHNITPGLAMRSLTSFFIFQTNVATSLMCEDVWKPITIHSVRVIQVGKAFRSGCWRLGQGSVDWEFDW